LGVVLCAAGCAEAETADLPRTPSGGGSGSGGSAGASSGSGGSGGATTGSGGSTGGSGGVSTGGSTGTGGSGATGGSTGTGGAGGKGGSGGGGSSGTGGSTGTGGAPRPDSGPPGPSGQIYFDDFEDGNSTTPSWFDGDATLGAVWSVVTREAGNHVFAQSAVVSDWVISVSGDYRWTDQVVEATVKRTSADGMIGIFGRVLDMRNYYFLYLDGSNIILRKRVDNSSANLVKIKFAMVSGTSYTLKLSIVGSTLTGYVDGAMLVTASDTFLTTGGIGVGTSDSGIGEFDNVRVSR
jgi:hypothetical protein